ncbi:MAG: shikimate dehydrogenase [Actinomycetota bacterium]
MVRPPISATTSVVAVIGSPIRHSLSPVIHNAAFAALDLDWAYVAFDVDADGAGAAVEAMRRLGLRGMSVTMPAKQGVAAAVDRCSADAELLGVVNCVRWDRDELVGENTDGEGFVRAFAEETGATPAGRRFVVLGAGGAARSIILALTRADAAEIIVVNRSPGAAAEAAALAGGVGRVGEPDDATSVDVVVNATSLGMAEGDPLPLAVDLLRPDTVVADIVYARTTSLLEAARHVGAMPVGGLGMLVHQAAVAFEHWTGRPAPVDVMRAAIAGG